MAAGAGREWTLSTRRVGLIAIMLFGLLLRTYKLDHLSFWIDEGFSALMAEPEYARLSVWLRDVHPPLYYALLSSWHVWSQSDWWLRFLSVVLGVATIPVVYGLGTHMFGHAAGLWAAALLSVLHIHVAYSQEARMYTLMVLLFAGALWGLVVGARDGRVVGWAVYAGSAAMLMYAQGLAPLFVVVLAALFPVIASEPRDWRSWLLANSVVVLVFAPYAFTYARRVRDVTDTFWLPPQSSEPPILTTLFQWTVLPIPPLSQILAHQLGVDIGPLFGRWVWFAPVLVVMAFALIRVPPERGWARSSLLLAYALPILVLSAIGLVIRPLLTPRVLLPTVVPVALLLGSFAAPASTRRVWRHAALSAVFVLLLAGTAFSLRYGAKEEWRRASHYLQKEVRSTDVVLFNVGGLIREGDIEQQGRFLINRYDERGVLARVQQVLVAELTASCGPDELPRCLGQRLRAYPNGQVIWLVESHAIPDTKPWLAAHLEVQETLHLKGIELARTVLR